MDVEWHTNGKRYCTLTMTRSSAKLIAALLVVVLTTSLNAAPAISHSDLRVRIEAITREIEKSPDAADLYVRRSKVYDQHGDWRVALTDLDRAQELGFDREDLGLYQIGRAHV